MGDAFFGPDISKFTATYDAAGALSIAIQFSAVVAPPIEISTGVAGGFSVDDLESVVCGGAGTPVLAIAISLSSVGPPSVGSATLSLPTGALPGAVDVDGSGTTVTASFNDGTLAGLAPVCAEQARVGGDVAPDGPPFAFLPFGGFAPLCADGIDNDGDGAVDLEDPGCRGALLGRDEIDPTPVAGSAHVQSLRRTRLCGFRLSAIAGPTIEPAALFPRDGTLRMTIRRLGGQGILRDRAEGPSASKWGVDYLARGSYRIEVRYLGDTFRRASIARAQKVRINGSRCFAPPSRAAYRRYGVRANRVSKALNRTAAEGGRIKLSAFPDGSWSAGARSLRRLAREFRAEASQWDAISAPSVVRREHAGVATAVRLFAGAYESLAGALESQNPFDPAIDRATRDIRRGGKLVDAFGLAIESLNRRVSLGTIRARSTGPDRSRFAPVAPRLPSLPTVPRQ